MVVAALASITTLNLAHVPTGDVLQFVTASIVPTVTILLVGDRVGRQVDDVHKQVNGRMSELIAKTNDRTDG